MDAKIIAGILAAGGAALAVGGIYSIFKSHLLHYFFSFVTNTRVAYKVGCEAQDVSFNSDSDPVAFFCCAIFLSTTEFFFAHILLKKAFCYDTILKI